MYKMDPTAYLYNDNASQNWKRSSTMCTEVQISKSLALLGMCSWDDLEPSKLTNGILSNINKY